MGNREAATAALDLMVSAMAARDAERFTSVYADDARVWHNTTRAEQSKAENAAYLAAIMKQFAAMEYTDIRRQYADNCIVQQHIVRATLPNGEVLEVPACLVVHIEGDKVKRIEEYLSEPDDHRRFPD